MEARQIVIDKLDREELDSAALGIKRRAEGFIYIYSDQPDKENDRYKCCRK